MTTPAPDAIPPLVKELTVAWDQEAAFRRFTADIGTWWPLRTHSVGQKDAESVVLEGRVGGRIVEHIAGGRESVWGRVTHWDPPHRVGFTWHPGRAESTAGQVEVTFQPDSSGTRVRLEHSGWELLGALARTARRGYALGWGGVLALYAGRPGAPIARINQALSALAGLVARFQRKPAPDTSHG